MDFLGLCACMVLYEVCGAHCEERMSAASSSKKQTENYRNEITCPARDKRGR